MRRPAPPLPRKQLDTLFERVRRDLGHVRMDTAFPERIETAIRFSERRKTPRWAAVAAAILLALGAATLKGEGGPVRAHTLGPPARPPASAPPTEDESPAALTPPPAPPRR